MEFVDSDKDGHLSFDEYKGEGNFIEFCSVVYVEQCRIRAI